MDLYLHIIDLCKSRYTKLINIQLWNVHSHTFLVYCIVTIFCTLKSRFNESRFNEIPRFSEQLPAPFNYFTIVNLIQFSELHDLVNKSGLTGLVC